MPRTRKKSPPTRRTSRKSAATPDPNGGAVLSHHRKRVYVIAVLFLCGYGVIAGRLGLLQGNPESRFAKEDEKHVGEIEIHRERGDILDREGRVLATDRKLPSLSADPSKLADPIPLANFLRDRLDLSAREVARLSQRDANGNPKKFVWLRRWLSNEALDSLGPLNEIPGGEALRVHMEPVRFYPEKDLAAHVLGFANREGVGSEGVELMYDQYLRSEKGRHVSRVDNRRLFLSYLTLEYEPPSGGHDVYLTLDATLQYELEQALDEAMVINKAPRAMGLLMDPQTGAVLALASRPAFDPNRYNTFDASLRKNRAIVDVFEPGSAFKVVPAAGALDLGLIEPTDRIDCENGSFNPYGHRIRDVHPLDVEPFTTCFAQSSNVAIIKVAAMLGEERLDEWIRTFGFGSRTQIDLPGESRGIYRTPASWSRLSMGSLPMGQEIAVTMPQLAAAYSAIANGGFSVQPHVVDRVVSDDGTIVYQKDTASPRRVMSPGTSAELRELCHLVVQGENTGRRAAIGEYRVGGKTGTAQIARPDGRGYFTGKDEKYTTVFAGFAPVADPKLVCVIVVPEPNIRNHYGGYVCGPVFKKVVRDTLIRMNVPQDPMIIDDGANDSDTLIAMQDADTMADRHAQRSEGAASKLDGLELLEEPADQGTSPDGFPNLLGLTKRQAIVELAARGIPWDAQGAGRVVIQIPPPGALLEEAGRCRLIFESAHVAAVPSERRRYDD